MCVIILKKRGQKTPSVNMLKAAHQQNHDGMGFATSSGYMWKGLDFDTFLKQLEQHCKEEEEVMIHFRWATHGSVCAKNCHPFKGTMQGENIFFMHNGVLSIPSKNDKTDSEICFREKILPTMRREGGLTDIADMLIEDYSEGCKFAMIYSGRLYKWGHWVNVNGYECSNSNFVWRMPSRRPRINESFWERYERYMAL